MAGYAAFDAAAYRHGDLTPVFFGSALKDFGVEQLIDALAEFAPPPREQPATPRVVEPGDPAVRSDEHTSELQSLMRRSYAVFCLKQKKYKSRFTAVYYSDDR